LLRLSFEVLGTLAPSLTAYPTLQAQQNDNADDRAYELQRADHPAVIFGIRMWKKSDGPIAEARLQFPEHGNAEPLVGPPSAMKEV
jgi:hypothetical protein